jgi:hypothetical protein
VAAAAFRKVTVQGATLGQFFAPAKPAFPPSLVVFVVDLIKDPPLTSINASVKSLIV